MVEQPGDTTTNAVAQGPVCFDDQLAAELHT